MCGSKTRQVVANLRGSVYGFETDELSTSFVSGQKMPSQLPEKRPEAHAADGADAEDAELERARSRVRQIKSDAESEGLLAKGRRLWTDFRAEADERNKAMLEDIERGKRKLAERQRELERGSQQPSSQQQPPQKKDFGDALPPLSASSSSRSSAFGDDDASPSSELMSRALGGFNAAFPFIGVVAGYSTIELMQQQKASFSIDLMTKGCFKGVARWLPIGFGAAVFYGVEYSLRRPVHSLVPAAVLEAPATVLGGIGLGGSSNNSSTAAAGKDQQKPKPAWAVATSPEDEANWLSKMLGGELNKQEKRR